MRCSIIVPTYNRAKSLRLALAALTRLDHDHYEVIVVDDGSTDETGPLVKGEFPQVRYVRFEKNRGEWAARNRGIAEAGGELLAFTDDDCIVARDWCVATRLRTPCQTSVPSAARWNQALRPSSTSFTRRTRARSTASTSGWSA